MPNRRGAFPSLVHVAAVAVVVNSTLLTVRKRGTSAFQLPGGKLEPGECYLQAALRETAEETGMVLRADQLRPLGSWRGEPANQDAAELSATVFSAHFATAQALPQRPQCMAEIAELRWQPLSQPAAPALAPLLREFVLPRLRHADGAL